MLPAADLFFPVSLAFPSLNELVPLLTAPELEALAPEMLEVSPLDNDEVLYPDDVPWSSPLRCIF